MTKLWTLKTSSKWIHFPSHSGHLGKTGVILFSTDSSSLSQKLFGRFFQSFRKSSRILSTADEKVFATSDVSLKAWQKQFFYFHLIFKDQTTSMRSKEVLKGNKKLCQKIFLLGNIGISWNNKTKLPKILNGFRSAGTYLFGNKGRIIFLVKSLSGCDENIRHKKSSSSTCFSSITVTMNTKVKKEPAV